MISLSAYAQVKISYGVPEGFDAVEMDNTASYVSTFDGKTLPGLIRYSQQQEQLVFDEKQYAANGIPAEEIAKIREVVSLIDYKQCVNGCDKEYASYYVTIDKLRRTLVIRSTRSDYLAPETNWGFVNNYSLNLSGSSDSYRSIYTSGNTYLGLPQRSFGYMNWYASRSELQGRKGSMQGISSYYVQKNFSETYVRIGKQNAIDYGSGAVSTMLTPSFDKFITIGNQENLRNTRDLGSLVLYATVEGNYEFYRGGRLIWRRPAELGRNEISFASLPGGYYPLEIRLLDRNGNILSTEVRDINNLNFSGGSNSWRVTAGQEMDSGQRLIQASVSRNLSQFYVNGSVVTGEKGRWAGELNLTRPSAIGTMNITPTIGLLGGERGYGIYGNLMLNDPVLGNLTMSRYQISDISRFYRGSPSTNFSYNRALTGSALLFYNYYKYSTTSAHQAELRWNYNPNGLWSTFALGVQKGGYMVGRDGGYALYFNTTWTLDKSQGSIRASQYGGQTQLSGDYKRSFQDNYGTTSVGVNAVRQTMGKGINAYVSRSGTRGDATLNVGATSDGRTNMNLNIQGMLAANADGIALGRYSSGGSAMLLKTPDLAGTPYGFNVNGNPVGSGGTYAVPVTSYGDVSFARVDSSSKVLDMNIEVPANIVRAHPGQVYSAEAKVDLNMAYNGLLIGPDEQPVGGHIVETGDTAYPNGLFAISVKTILTSISVQQKNGLIYLCDLSQQIRDGYYRCQPKVTTDDLPRAKREQGEVALK
ncbi:TcfC E-set like domain-containing protein [Herminiimonas sp. KBW02]|uniref:TcfC E-set like domain-containing protein n=1 Tax=Herminiimonas sp. KBW02 TaxID=2153363 RepID=UPI001F411F56|nr:TcfC E-set like domain-containing protein [Herminiimonas sp. KBW02]